MLSALRLSDDVWTLILLLLDVPDLRQCRAVCRHFYHLITAVDTLAFRLELDASGYVEPGNLRQDLTVGQRLAVLREHMSRRQSLIPSRVDTCWDVSTNDNSTLISSPEELMFTGDTVARWVTEDRGNGRHSARLDIVSFASPNKGTDISQWSLY
ncbi:hypothetical protein B0J17DRAFT_74011 [Rhizoctonia solani]|nr:hypothetical protein B0J17DRAFT_74011 [Rhizoctonia solani]